MIVARKKVSIIFENYQEFKDNGPKKQRNIELKFEKLRWVEVKVEVQYFIYSQSWEFETIL